MTKRERARAARAKAMAMRVAGEEEDEGGKAMTMATRRVGKWTAMATKRLMAITTRVTGE